ncbi:MAG TPA: hypothetical protein VMC61_02590 [Methanocella sp.]|nr:hypothetical protein [Methanocella sp.]
MVETFGMAGMLVLAFFALAAIYIIMRLLDRPPVDEEPESGEAAPRREAPTELSDEEFVGSYTGPMLEDAREKLELAIESAEAGLHFYGQGKWEEAGGEFHIAANNVDNAMGRLREVIGMVEDQGSAPVRQAKARLEESRRIRALAIRMEEACDAMVEGKTEEAQKLAMVKNELERAASAFKEERSPE